MGDLSLTWFQYVLIVQNGFSYEIQYWSTNAKGYAKGQPWPPSYSPNPPGTTPWLPVFPNTALFGGFGSDSSSQIPAGSTLEIQLTTDPSTGNVTAANFSVTDPHGNVSSAPSQNFSAGQQFALYGFQVDLVSPPSSATTFTSGAGLLTYAVSGQDLTIQTGSQTSRLHPARNWGRLQRHLRSADARDRFDDHADHRRHSHGDGVHLRQVDLRAR